MYRYLPLCHRFGHGSDFSKLASSEQEEQTDYVVGVSPQTNLSAILCDKLLLTRFLLHPNSLFEIDLGSFILHYFSLHLLGRCDHCMQVHGETTSGPLRG